MQGEIGYSEKWGRLEERRNTEDWGNCGKIMETLRMRRKVRSVRTGLVIVVRLL